MALEKAGFSVNLSKPTEDDPDLWNVESQVNRSPFEVTTPLFVEGLVRLAAEQQSTTLPLKGLKSAPPGPRVCVGACDVDCDITRVNPHRKA